MVGVGVRQARAARGGGAMNDPASELTVRELEVLQLVCDGLGNRAIADRLGVTKNTVRYHLKQIHSRLGTEGDRERLVALARCLWPSSGS